jgi:L-threonylcarbamoyladenylate synthase
LTTTEKLAAYSASATEPDPAAIARAANLLRQGGLVAFPTETVYGLGADALDERAVARIFEAKGRPANNPVIVHVAAVEAAMALCTVWPAEAGLLAAAFWPGPLTLVLPKQAAVPGAVTGGGSTVALRVPSHPVALALLRAAGIPIAAPSANRSMELSPTTADHVASSLGGRIDLILDGGPTPGGIESTVLSLAGERPLLLRPGLVSPGEIEAIIGPIRRSANDGPAGQAASPSMEGRTLGGSDPRRPADDRSLPPLTGPGMLPRHYAPRAPLEVAVHGEERVRQLLAEGRRVGWLTRADAQAAWPEAARLVCRRMPAGAREYASRLYGELHALDAAGVDRIVVDALPADDSWLALRDRLERASTPAE